MKHQLWFVLLAGWLSSCSLIATKSELEARAKDYRSTAMQHWKSGQHDLALAAIASAIHTAKRLPMTHLQTIESYDDAGLYYYVTQQYKKSAYHQAVAVLLACGEPDHQNMFPVYVKRLGWAFAHYRPTQAFQPIAAHPLILFDDKTLNVKNNPRLRRKYYKLAYNPHGLPRRRMRLKRRPDVVAGECEIPGE